MSQRYFGTDGIRGTVGRSPITPDFMTRLGMAIGSVLRDSVSGSARPAVVVGKDTRVSGYMIESALEAGLLAAGVDVHLCGPLPTPGVAYLTRALRLSAGVVISASHNPYPDNGIKLFSASGEKLSDALEAAIEARLDAAPTCLDSDRLGRAYRVEAAVERYVEFCKSTLPSDFDLRGLRLVVDCAHGAGYDAAPRVFRELGADVVAMGHQPDGFNINAGVGATHPEALSQAVTTHRADAGVALDGDGDRLIMVDADGTVIDGDQLLYVIAADRQRRGLRDAGVVGTVMTNLGVEIALRRIGIELRRAPVGDRHVLAMLQQLGWCVGGEGSGHLVCLDQHSTGDGIIAALQVLRAMRESASRFDALLAPVGLLPQVLINVALQTSGRPPVETLESEVVRAAVRHVEAELGPDGRIVLRPSGTEPVIRVMVEGRDEHQVKRCAETLTDAVRGAA